MRAASKPTTYEVTLRRDVQQIARVRVEATSRQEAIDIAEANASEEDGAWQVKEHIGAHKPRVETVRAKGIS